MSKQKIQTLISDLCKEMESLWQKNNYSAFDKDKETQVVTRIQDNAAILPKSQFPIRGTAGIEVTTTSSNQGYFILHLGNEFRLFQSLSYMIPTI